jgi:hypothetical protein
MARGISITLGVILYITAPIIALIFPEIGGLGALILGFVCGIMGSALILPHIFLKQQ